jgi:hypothetical protein
MPNAWFYGANIVDKAGQSPTSEVIQKACPKLAGALNGPPPVAKGNILGGHASAVRATGGARDAFTQCINTLSSTYHEVVTYQPANRFWTFQTIETALFVVLALALTGFCAWWVRHRIS